jgi:hypothetical protein
MRAISIIALILLTLISCEKSVNKRAFNATVIGKGLDCGNSFLLQFDRNAVGVPMNYFDNIFYEINLPDKFKVAGKQINLIFREPVNDEIMVCTMAGPGYPQIYILQAE